MNLSLLAACACLSWSSAPSADPSPRSMSPHTFAVQGSQFLLDGKPFRIRCGEMHYARVPRPYWRQRFRMMRAMGLNAVCTYVFWNLEEPQPGKFDFKGNNDIAEYVREAQEEGLWVLLRPGPYACAEWDWGGFPYWLARIPGVKVRSDDPKYVEAATGYLERLGKELAPLQVTHGGPILMVQVENEYGSFGANKTYLGAIHRALQAGGFDTLLYTADGPSDQMLGGGTLPDVLPVVNFGGDPNGSFKELEKFRPGVPMMCGEFYPGWFDSWGRPHANTSTQGLANDIEWMESHGASYSLYVVHGGTSFGFMNGANWYDGGYVPQTTSYDYSTTLDEAGRPTAKYWAFREVVARHLPPGEHLPEVPSYDHGMAVKRFVTYPIGTVFDLLGKPSKAEHPLTFEELNQAYGFVLYRTYVPKGFKGTLKLEGLQDRAQVFTNGFYAGVIERMKHQDSLDLDVPAADGGRLDILVENMGRINYGHQLLTERKGFVRALLGGREQIGWEMYRLPMDKAPAIHHAIPVSSVLMPTVYEASFQLAELHDTFLDMRGWRKGVVWVNGHNLGRYWRVGPQQSLYVPAPWLNVGRNKVTVFELENSNQVLIGSPDPIFELEAKG